MGCERLRTGINGPFPPPGGRFLITVDGVATKVDAKNPPDWLRKGAGRGGAKASAAVMRGIGPNDSGYPQYPGDKDDEWEDTPMSCDTKQKLQNLGIKPD